MPLAIDTNVLIRAVVDDGTEQTARAARWFVSHEIFVPTTVMLETEWVLRSRVKLEHATINRLLNAIASAPHVQLEQRERMLDAIEAHRAGLDFADALHLFAATQCEAIGSFDRNFRNRAKKIEHAVPVVAP